MDAADITRVVGYARRFLPPEADHENIAMDILLESWLKGHEKPSRTFIKNRCWDALRRRRTELQANEGHSFKTPESSPDQTGEVDFDNLMTKLVKNLSVDERRAVWYKFYQGLKVPEMSRRMGIGKAKAYNVLKEALYKMRQEHRDG